MSAGRRFPAEWEPQSAVLIAWPHEGTDWAKHLGSVEGSYVALVSAIVRFQRVVILVADDALQCHVDSLLRTAAARIERVLYQQICYDDTWLRDSGPITVRDIDGYTLLDFHFTAWGGKFAAGNDDRIVAGLHARGLFGNANRQRIEFALEGGAVETDGAGTLLTTWHCLHQRHPELSRSEITERLQQWLRQDRTLWLDRGYLEGDDTDAHIDTLARFASTDSIIYQGCDDPLDSHFTELQAMAAQLTAFRTRGDQPYRLFALPWAKPILDEGRRLAASYANFLVINDAVLMPVYDDPADSVAAAVMQQAFPDREIIPIPCRPLIWQNGSLHCLTMQLPEGLLS